MPRGEKNEVSYHIGVLAVESFCTVIFSCRRPESSSRFRWPLCVFGDSDDDDGGNTRAMGATTGTVTDAKQLGESEDDVHPDIHTAMSDLDLGEDEVLALIQEFEDENGHVDLDALHVKLQVRLLNAQLVDAVLVMLTSACLYRKCGFIVTYTPSFLNSV